MTCGCWTSDIAVDPCSYCDSIVADTEAAQCAVCLLCWHPDGAEKLVVAQLVKASLMSKKENLFCLLTWSPLGTLSPAISWHWKQVCREYVCFVQCVVYWCCR